MPCSYANKFALSLRLTQYDSGPKKVDSGASIHYKRRSAGKARQG